MATLSNKTLAALTLAALTIGMAQPAYAATTSPSTKTQTTSTNTTGSGTQAQQYFSPDGLRSIQTSRGSLQLQTLDGDNVTVNGSLATWTDKDNNVVAQIELSSLDGRKGVVFAYDKATSRLGTLDALLAITERGCMPKSAGFAWKMAWDGLVCFPISLAAGAATIETAGWGFPVAKVACKVAGKVIVKAVSC